MSHSGIEPLGGVGERAPLPLHSNQRQHEVRIGAVRPSGGIGARSSEEQLHFDQRDLEQAVQDVNRQLKVFDRRLHYQIDQDTKRIIVKVINVESGETIRQIPPDQVLRAAQLINELRGLLIDERV